MYNPQASFRSLLSPVEPEAFLSETFGKAPLHIPGSAAKIKDFFSLDAFSRLLDMTDLWSVQSLSLYLDGEAVPVQEYSKMGHRDGDNVLRPDPMRVAHFMDQGASVVMNNMQTYDAGVKALASTLQLIFRCPVNCNLYFSRSQRQAFPPHYDSMDVFALHVDGQKTWELYETYVDRPVNREGYRTTDFPREYHEKNKGPVDRSVTMKPGDLLYIPRGKYHAAMADSELSLHLSFGLFEQTGLKFVEAVIPSLVQDPLFRTHMPNYDDAEAYQKHATELVSRLQEILVEPQLLEQVRTERAYEAIRNLSGFRSSDAGHPAFFRVHTLGARIVRRGADRRLERNGATETLPGLEGKIAEWALKSELFTVDDLTGAFPDVDGDGLQQALEKLASIGLIEAL